MYPLFTLFAVAVRSFNEGQKAFFSNILKERGIITGAFHGLITDVARTYHTAGLAKAVTDFLDEGGPTPEQDREMLEMEKTLTESVEEAKRVFKEESDRAP